MTFSTLNGRPVRCLLFLVAFAILSAFILGPSEAGLSKALPAAAETPGELQIIGPDKQPAGFCPLQHTDVTASIAGYVARVLVRQTFHNPSVNKIEAVYVFPLPQDSAVDSMSMLVGARKIIGTIKPKAEARQIYNDARNAGYTASLLDQERPNIFSQYVANIEPGNDVTVEITYTEMLKYHAGVYELVFPMVVGPRYNGGSTVTGNKPVTDHINPPITPEGTRSGHDIGISVAIDAGAPIANIQSELHAVDVIQPDPSHATVSLRNMNEIPNKDFILRYRTTTDNVSEAFLTHTDTTGNYFTLVLQPPHRTVAAQVVPKEMIFVIDQTGSQRGAPIEKAKECIRYCLKNLNLGDTFQVLAFNTSVYPCFPAPVPATADNVDKAIAFINPLEGNGGTDILQASDYVFKIPNDPNRLRVISYMTDGYVGNDTNIISFIKAHRGSATMFPFGTGNSVNRYLIDGMATAGGGEPEYVDLSADGQVIAQEFYNRVHNPVLTNVKLAFEGVNVSEIYPRSIPDLFSEKPIMIHGRFDDLASGTLTITGDTAAGPYTRTIALSPHPDSHPALPSLWARAKIDDLTLNYFQQDSDVMQPDAVTAITNLGVDYHLMTQYTSFVAVDTSHKVTAPDGGTVDTPVEMPDGVTYQGIFGAPAQSSQNNVRISGNASFIARSNRVAGNMYANPSGAVTKNPSSSYQNLAGLRHSTFGAPAPPAAMHAAPSAVPPGAGGALAPVTMVPQPATETGFFGSGASGDAYYTGGGAICHVKVTPGLKVRSVEINVGNNQWLPMIFDTRTGTWTGSTSTGNSVALRVTTRKGEMYTILVGYPFTGKDGAITFRLDDAHACHAASVTIAGSDALALSRVDGGRFEGSRTALAKVPAATTVTYTLENAEGNRTVITIGH